MNFRNISDGFSSEPPFTNANDIRQNGTWKAYAWTNTPNGHSIGILSSYYYDTGYGYQLFDDYYDGELYRRQIVNNSWSAWKKLVTEGSATAIKHTGPINGGAQIQVARGTGRVYRVSMFRNANSSVALVDQWGAVAYITNTGSFVITADSTTITAKNNSGAYCNAVVEEM